MKTKTIVVDGITFEQKQKTNDIQIVVLQRGHVMIGRFFRENSDCTLTDAYVIRRWGTDEGLGQLAEFGKRTETVLDKCYRPVKFDILTTILMIECNGEIWEKEL